MRLAMVYALLDQARVVRVEHLKAAIAVWEYCEASARYIFGASLGDRDADELLRALQAAPDGLTRKQISVDVFGKHRSADAIGRALATLVQAGLAAVETRADTGGRPEERWFAKSVGDANKANYANKVPAEGAPTASESANKANKGSDNGDLSSLNSLSSHPPGGDE